MTQNAERVCPECGSTDITEAYDGYGVSECQGCGWQFLPDLRVTDEDGASQIIPPAVRARVQRNGPS